jgi:hypothetical protein
MQRGAMVYCGYCRRPFRIAADAPDVPVLRAACRPRLAGKRPVKGAPSVLSLACFLFLAALAGVLLIAIARYVIAGY